MNKPARSFAKPLRDLLGKVVGDSFTRQGFASAELVTRWPEIAGAEIAAHSEPIKIQWPRPDQTGIRPPGTLVLRVEGPAAIEIQHLAHLICERVNRFLGWRAVERITLSTSAAATYTPPLRPEAGCRGRGALGSKPAGDRRRQFAGGTRTARRCGQTPLTRG